MEIDVTVISDTHTLHNKCKLSGGHLLIHGGDMTDVGSITDVDNFIKWFAAQDYEYKIFIAGNHDFYFEEHTEQEIQNKIESIAGKNSGIIYLNDSGIKLFGLNIWGSPVQPRFYDWAFNRNRGADIMQHWHKIPNDTDILITHGPPHGMLDLTAGGTHEGCEDLLNKIMEIKPAINIFGHIHEGYGYKEFNDTLFLNASILNYRNQYQNKPIDLHLNTNTKEYRFR